MGHINRVAILIALLIGISKAFCQDTLSITLENVKYPHPVRLLSLKIENQDLRMAYMDVSPVTTGNGRTVMLFHGKNFGGYYWTNVVKHLTGQGYRVIIPDQIGFAKSSKPLIGYSFQTLAEQNKKLLDSLKIQKVILLGHSMGGMLATRFALLYPQRVEKLILENPLGLEDYRTFVPKVTTAQQYQKELKTTAESIKDYYRKSYFPEWKPEYDRLVSIASGIIYSSDFPRAAMVSALTYQMIYEQPVVQEFSSLKVPTVLIIGIRDRTVLGKEKLSDAQRDRYGNYAELGKLTAGRVTGSKLVELNSSHIPHLEIPEEFFKALSSAL